MATLSTHVLDTGRGRPASGVALCLEAADGTVLQVIEGPLPST